jgi:NADPH-dependent curcumin reductase CurA
MSSQVLTHMNPFGRISVCGAITAYSDADRPKGKFYTL